MSLSGKKPATYDDLFQLPENTVGEIINVYAERQPGEEEGGDSWREYNRSRQQADELLAGLPEELSVENERQRP